MMCCILFILLCALSVPVQGQDRPSASDGEVAWSKYLANQMGGVSGDVAGYALPDGSRVDIITDDAVWEVEWCSKWKESFGQAMFYSWQTGKHPGVILLKRGQKDDENYLRARGTLSAFRENGTEFRFIVIEVTKGE